MRLCLHVCYCFQQLHQDSRLSHSCLINNEWFRICCYLMTQPMQMIMTGEEGNTFPFALHLQEYAGTDRAPCGRSQVHLHSYAAFQSRPCVEKETLSQSLSQSSPDQAQQQIWLLIIHDLPSQTHFPLGHSKKCVGYLLIFKHPPFILASARRFDTVNIRKEGAVIWNGTYFSTLVLILSLTL